jgi:hypothetical protein
MEEEEMNCSPPITTPAFPEGASGSAGGDLEGAYPAPLIAPTAIHGKPVKAVPEPDDEILLWDSSTSTLRRMTRTDFLTGIIGYTDAQARDAVGAILGTSATIILSYDALTPAILAGVIDGSITTLKLADGGVTFAKLQDINSGRLLGRSSVGTGDAEEITIGSGLVLSGGTLSASGGSSSGWQLWGPVLSASLTISASQTQYTSALHSSTNLTENVVKVAVPRALTISQLMVRLANAQPSSGSLVFTVRKNGVDTAVTLTIAAGSLAGVYSDTVNSVAFSAGDEFTIMIVNNATTSSAAMTQVSVVAE